MSSLKRCKSSETTTITYAGKNGDWDIKINLPAVAEVCDRCRGHGKHVNPNVDGHGISPEEFAEDPDFKEAYFAGRYDVRCEECRGEKVVWVIDEARLTKFQRI